MKKYSKYLLPSLYIGVIAVMIVCATLVVGGIKSFVETKTDIKYVLDDVFDGDNISPVMKNDSNLIIRPYISDKVKIGKYFYDYETDNKKQEESIIVYENTYLQNNGVDYISEESFDIVSVLDGEVIGIEDSEIYGKILTIKHNDNLETIYSNIGNILVNVGYKVAQGEIIATSDKYKLDTKVNSMLHFEVHYKGDIMDPENLYTLKVSDLK